MVTTGQTRRVLRSLGPVDLEGFDGRLRAQKLAHLVQEIDGGLDGFTYHWYVRGPYSPALARALSDAGQPQEEARTGISGAERELAGRVRSLVGDRLDSPLDLELCASVWHLAPARSLSDGDRSPIMVTMERTKPHFDGEQATGALARIERFGRAAKFSTDAAGSG